VQSLLEDYSLGGKTESTGIREKYQTYLENNGKAALWQLLEETDPKASAIIHQNNSRKIIRALEVFENTGKSIINADGESSLELYDTKIIGLITDRELLYQRINERVDKMMNDGLLDEAKLLFEKYPNAQAVQGIGYKEFFPYFKGESSLTQCVELVKKNSRNYAKRQITWFRNRMDTQWFDIVQNPVEIERITHDLANWLDGGK
jgi:tRNA dimethylallyltransferase